MEKPRALVVDDESIIRMLNSDVLEENYSVDTACDGAEGLAMLEQNEYAVIITDLDMPKLNGLEMIRQYRIRKGATATTPFIIYTAGIKKGLPQEIDNLVATTGDHILVLQKPCGNDFFLSNVDYMASGKTPETRFPMENMRQ